MPEGLQFSGGGSAGVGAQVGNNPGYAPPRGSAFTSAVLAPFNIGDPAAEITPAAEAVQTTTADGSAIFVTGFVRCKAEATQIEVQVTGVSTPARGVVFDKINAPALNDTYAFAFVVPAGGTWKWRALAGTPAAVGFLVSSL